MPCPATTQSRLRPDLLAVSAVVNWGLSYGLPNLAFAEWPPLAFTAPWFFAMDVIAVAVLVSQGRLGVPFGPDFARFAGGGFLGFTLYQLGFVLGLDRTSAFSSALLLSTIPLFSLLFLRIGAVEVVGRRQWTGVGIATIGIVLFVWAKKAGPSLGEARLGDLLSLGAAASFALYGIVSKPLTMTYPASTVLAGSLLLGSLPLMSLGLVESPLPALTTISAGGWTVWAYSVVFPVYLGYTWWTAAIAARGVGAMAPYVLLVPLVGGLFALLWLGEGLTALQIVGAGLTLTGLAVARDWIRRPTPAPAVSGSGL